MMSLGMAHFVVDIDEMLSQHSSPVGLGTDQRVHVYSN